MEAIEKLEQKREKSEEENSIEHEEILELREPIEKILTALKDSIEKGEYQLVIGDDKSGRIPTFILHKVIGALYEKHDHPRPRTRFFAGIHVPDKNLEQQRIEQIRRHVSEYIIKYGKPTNGFLW
ncbi:MAG: hypothetical protein Q7R73_04775 [bacterium]|nr:hypothetical protein [bacterium]